MPVATEGRLRLRIVQAAIVISVAVGGVLLWYQEHEQRQHLDRMQQIEQLRDEAQRQQEFSDQLLANARSLLTTVEDARSAPHATDDAQPPALSPDSPAERPANNSPPPEVPAPAASTVEPNSPQ